MSHVLSSSGKHNAPAPWLCSANAPSAVPLAQACPRSRLQMTAGWQKMMAVEKVKSKERSMNGRPIYFEIRSLIDS